MIVLSRNRPPINRFMSFDLSNQPIDLILLQKINHVPGDLFMAMLEARH
ncbi:hypothetical protein HanHA300_Chr09g0333101 [Helianthus annuus]|nr:hypothetical protein HanHA300_Chr09g0333101 [Helianthus annuus]KAJ0543755.1 hypothetical protein HanHA89_Chr09g0354081 [Helianthus annuus]KAJ0708809.1 hypothetical protein HanLR1_Chr09g0333391 [Helianthus annuus]KAJ0712719.1 hypothetical protein HanOQP8_Chr09g0337871 [Helianthus annuus]